MGRLLEEKAAIAWPRKTFEGWERYPTNLSTYDRNAIDGEALNLELSGFSDKLFCSKGCSIGVEVLDIEGSQSFPAHLFVSLLISLACKTKTLRESANTTFQVMKN